MRNADKIQIWRKANPVTPMTPEIVKEILGTKSLIQSSLYGANLSGADLSGADLRGADLYSANLSGTNLYRALLTGADLRDADLRATNLHSTNLTDTNLSCADLRDANLYDANLTDADLRSADLRGANLSHSLMSGTDLRDTDLRSTNLYKSNLSDADLRMTNFHGFIINITPSGLVTFAATPDGWRITIGCWKNKTLEELAELIESPDSEWPQAREQERNRREPILRGIYETCLAFQNYYSTEIEKLTGKWNKNRPGKGNWRKETNDN